MDKPRGRPRHGDDAKTASLRITTTPEMRDLVVRVARESGRSVTQEVEHRLSESFELRGSAKSVTDAPLLTQIAGLIAMVESRTGLSWKEDQATFEAVARGVVRLVERRDPQDYSPEWLEAHQALLSSPEDPSISKIFRKMDEPFDEARQMGDAAAEFIHPRPRRHKGLRKPEDVE